MALGIMPISLKMSDWTLSDLLMDEIDYERASRIVGSLPNVTSGTDLGSYRRSLKPDFR